MEILDKIAQCVVDMDRDSIEQLIREALDKKIDVKEIYDKGLNKGMTEALDMYEKKEYYLPEIVVCADTLNKGLDILRAVGDVNSEDDVRITMAVVQGDTHEIGKNIVKVMMEASGFNVHDMGVNQSSKAIIEDAINNKSDIIALSSMMTSTMENMRTVIEDLNKLDLEKRPLVIVGGAPMNPRFAEEIGADGYSENAPRAVALVKKLIEE